MPDFAQIIHDTQENKWVHLVADDLDCTWTTNVNQAKIFSDQNYFDEVIDHLGGGTRFIGQNPPPR